YSYPLYVHNTLVNTFRLSLPNSTQTPTTDLHDPHAFPTRRSTALMVDAAVAGTTGINTAEGKNLVGSFHAPAGAWKVPTRFLPSAVLMPVVPATAASTIRAVERRVGKACGSWRSVVGV